MKYNFDKMYIAYYQLTQLLLVLSILITKMSESTQTQITVINDKYYKIHNKPMLYDIRFPLAWAIAIHTQVHKPYCNFGPGWCWECRDKGILNGVFVGFCNYCATYRLDGKYGTGTETPLSELSQEDIWRLYPYMEGTSIQEIGIMRTPERGTTQEFRRMNTPTEEKNDEDLTPFQSREHMEAYEQAERERLSLVQEQDQEYSEHALLVTMGRSVLNNNCGPMGQQMSWAEYREYLLEDLLG